MLGSETPLHKGHVGFFTLQRHAQRFPRRREDAANRSLALREGVDEFNGEGDDLPGTSSLALLQLDDLATPISEGQFMAEPLRFGMMVSLRCRPPR